MSAKKSFKVSFDSSPHNTSGPAVCRICHSGENSIPYWGTDDTCEPLISPCNCKGSTGLFHRSCMLYWLRSNSKKCCEICKHEFKTVRVYPNFLQFLQIRGFGLYEDTNLGADIVIFFVMTTICYTAGPMLLLSATTSADWFAKSFLAILILVMHFLWLGSTVITHFVLFRQWRIKNPRDVFIDQELNETHSFEERNWLGQFLCCGKPRLVVTSQIPTGLPTVVRPLGRVSPVESLYASHEEDELNLEAVDIDPHNEEERSFRAYQLGNGIRHAMNMGSPVSMNDTIGVSREVQERLWEDARQRQMNTRTRSSSGGSSNARLSTFLPLNASSPQQDRDAVEAMDMSRELSPLLRDADGNRSVETVRPHSSSTISALASQTSLDLNPMDGQGNSIVIPSEVLSSPPSLEMPRGARSPNHVLWNDVKSGIRFIDERDRTASERRRNPDSVLFLDLQNTAEEAQIIKAPVVTDL